MKLCTNVPYGPIMSDKTFSFNLLPIVDEILGKGHKYRTHTRTELLK